MVGLTGVGGGSLVTPLLVLVFGIHPATAVGTDLLYAGATKSVGTAVHGANRTVDWRIVGKLAAGSIPATALTLLVIAHADKKVDTTHGVITMVLGVALISTAIAILFRQRILDFFAKRTSTLQAGPDHRPHRGPRGGFLGNSWYRSPRWGPEPSGVTVLLIFYPVRCAPPGWWVRISPTPCLSPLSPGLATG